MKLKISVFFLLPMLQINLFAADRVALVIGNDAYQHARKLNAAVNDATAIGDSLRKLNFKVISVSNAGVEAMLEAVDTLKKEAQGASSVVVYYAGHGIESGGVNYLVPVDARLERELQLKTQTVSLDGILEELKEVKVPARMIILDCCRDNPLEGRSWLETRSSGGGLAALTQDMIGEATLVVYSASPGKPALDRVDATDAHSPFASALLDQLPKPGVHSFEMFGLVEDGVIKRTGGRQAPRIFYNGSTQPFRNFRFTTGESVVESISPAPEPERDSSLSGVLQSLVTIRPPDSEPAAVDMPSPTVAPSSPQLPERGFFDINELYTGGPYASYNVYSRANILRRVQQKLKEQGHYNSGLDGNPGPSTQRAIIAWQQANGLEANGKLDEATLNRIGLSDIDQANPPAPSSRPKPTPSRQSRPAARDDFFKDT